MLRRALHAAHGARAGAGFPVGTPVAVWYRAPVATPKRRATYDDLHDLPENMNGEILDGELFATPRPAPRHARAALILGADLVGSFDGPLGPPDRPGGWWFLFEPEIYIGDDVLIPDLAGWRVDGAPPRPSGNGFVHVPDWVCEVISPSTGAIDRGRKMRIYAHGGIGHLWIVDPMARTLEIYRLESGRWVVLDAPDGDQAVRGEPFDALPLDLARCWTD